MRFQYDDGGRAAAGFRGDAGDCVTRAIAIATHQDYLSVYHSLNALAKSERTGKSKRGVSSARNGVYKHYAEKKQMPKLLRNLIAPKGISSQTSA